MNALLRGLIFLVGVIFDLWIWVLMLRFVVQKAGVSYHNPISQILLRLTEWLLKPTRRYLHLKHWRGFDMAIVGWSVIFSWLDAWLLSYLMSHFQSSMPVLVALLQGVLMLVKRIINLAFFAILIRALLSWIPQAMNSPWYALLCRITDPLLNVFRRFIPRIAGIDLSVLWALLALQLVNVIVFGQI